MIFRLKAFDVRSQLSHECGGCGLHTKTSTISHSQAEMDYFAYHGSTEGDVVLYYFGTLVYHFPMNALNTRVYYEEGVMAATLNNSIPWR